MKYVIILIIILIIFVLYAHKNVYKKYNEKYINISDEEKLNTVFNNCGNRSGLVEFDRIKIMGKVNNKSLNQFLLDLAYPVGSFYVQFPVKGSNRSSEAFPATRTPAVLFGGDWQEQWKYESIYFRTPGEYSNENRVNGFQNYATKLMTGDTTYSQAHYITIPQPVSISSSLLLPITKTTTTTTTPVTPAPLDKPYGDGNSGIFDSFIIKKIGTDGGRDIDTVTRVYFDLSGYYNKSVDTPGYSYVSDLETRVKNRIIKIWKRIQRDASGNLPQPLENGYTNTQYDEKYYEGPEHHKYLDRPIPNISEDPDGKNGFEKAMEFCNKQEDNCNFISFADGTWRYGNMTDTIKKDPKSGLIYDKIGGKERPNFKIWTKREVPNIRINQTNETT
jgi:hypothetical protein